MLLVTGCSKGVTVQSGYTEQIDSLRKVVAKFEGKEKLDKYRELASKCSDNAIYAVVHQLYNDMEAEAQRQDDIDCLAYVFFNRLRLFFNESRFDDVIKTAPEYLEFLRRKGKDNHTHYYNICYIQIKTYIVNNDVGTATIIAQQIFEQAREQNNKAGMAIALHCMGEIYRAQSRPDKQEKSLREAIDLFESCNDDDASDLCEHACLQLCIMLLNNNRPDDALKIILKIEKLFQVRYDRTGIPYVNLLSLYTKYYIIIGEYDKAEMYYCKLDSISPRNIFWLVNGAFLKSQILEGRGQYDDALEIIDNSLKTLDTFNNAVIINSIKKMKIQLLAKMEQFDKAFDLAMHIIDANDSQHRKDLAYQVDELRTKYNLDKQERETRHLLYYVCIASVLLTVTALIWWRHTRVVKKKNQGLLRKISEQDKLFAERENEYKQLQDINAALTNTVNSVNSIIGNSDDGIIITNKDMLYIRLNKLLRKDKMFTHKNISRTSVAKELGVNERSLYDCVKINTGMNFTNYVTYLRMAYARELLTNDKLTLEGIAIEAGFGTRVTFYRIFKENYGLSPDEYRKSMNKKKASQKTKEEDDFEED
jgi:AraC-like DNA-binding protein